MLKLGKRLFTTANYDNITLTIREKVALVQLNRPNALNSLNSNLINELRDSLSTLENNDSVTCVVLTGDSKSFAGYPLALFKYLIYFSWRRYRRNEQNGLP